MKKIAVFDAKKYDQDSFAAYEGQYQFTYYNDRLLAKTVNLAKDYDAVVCFVNDELNDEVLTRLKEFNIHGVFLRCAGYNNVDLKSAYKNKIHVARVPAYSPYAVAEHTFALILSLNRHIHKAYIRSRDFNFNLESLTGFDLYDKTVGVIGTGKIGRVFINIARGFGMKVLCYDPYPIKDSDYKYVTLEEIYKNADIISLHCPLTDSNYHMIDKNAIAQMKQGVMIINTSRGGLIDSKALLEGLKEKKIGSVGLDVYEEEADLFYHDNSSRIIDDDVLALLISMPNVIITSHQAYLTKEALDNIARTTINNLNEYFSGEFINNELCYHCDKSSNPEQCYKNKTKRCF
ncbi:MAG TPA: 2-hydroxyacid dehydrogenase [Erysipelotrichaceae bacterium]|nr:2-hydroxyacid dehydrogenase [Erysipelotrichaceae bacterium]